MRRKTALGLLSVAFLLATRAQAQNPTDLRREAKEKEFNQEILVNLELEAARAIQWNSGGLFRRVCGEDFLGVLPSGQIKDKAGWIASIEGSGLRYSSFIATDIRVRMYEETAVVTCMWTARGTQGGHPFSRQWRVIHVYVFGQRSWQMVASQQTQLPG